MADCSLRTPGVGPEGGQKVPSAIVEILCNFTIVATAGFLWQSCWPKVQKPI